MEVHPLQSKLLLNPFLRLVCPYAQRVCLEVLSFGINVTVAIALNIIVSNVVMSCQVLFPLVTLLRHAIRDSNPDAARNLVILYATTTIVVTRL